MPCMSKEVENRTKRFKEQRWIIDNIVKTVGLEWDQGRIGYSMTPCGIGAMPDFQRVQARCRKFNDIAREFGAAALHRQRRAEEYERQGYTVSARESFFIASVLYGQAQWPIFENTRQNIEYEQRKNYCYAQYAKYADHIVRQAEIPFEGKSLPGWLHLPLNYKQGTKVPCVLAIGGMDSAKEILVSMYGDQFLTRGIAVFALDGPGQASCTIREIRVTATNFMEAGRATLDWIKEQPEIDINQIALKGESMGSIWATQIATVAPEVKCCVVAYLRQEKGENTAFNMESPTFKLRFMYMSGYTNEEEFDEFSQSINADGLGAKIKCPYLAVGGEDDDFASIEPTFDLMNEIQTPKELLLYRGERHTLHSNNASSLGPNEQDYMADWIADRFQDKPLESNLAVVTSRGQIVREPWGEHQSYDFGLPDLD